MLDAFLNMGLDAPCHSTLNTISATHDGEMAASASLILVAGTQNPGTLTQIFSQQELALSWERAVVCHHQSTTIASRPLTFTSYKYKMRCRGLSFSA
jgi:hypothetical protein